MPIDVMAIVTFLVGLLLLLLGRSLFWLVVGGAGFLVGIQLAATYLAGQEQWVMVLAAFIAGLIGAILAIFLERAAFALAGLVAGAALAVHLAAEFGWGEYQTIALIVGAVGGLIAAIALTDWAIIVLSALVGAAAIVAALNLEDGTRLIVLAVLVVIGIAVQGATLRRVRRTTR